MSFGQLQDEDTWFELSPRQQSHFRSAQLMNAALSDGSHSIQQLLWKSGYEQIFGNMPDRSASYILKKNNKKTSHHLTVPVHSQGSPPQHS